MELAYGIVGLCISFGSVMIVRAIAFAGSDAYTAIKSRPKKVYTNPYTGEPQ